VTGDLGYERTNDLLEQLDAAKKAYQGPRGKLKDMLGDPAISGLVNEIILENRAWIRSAVAFTKRNLHLKETPDELFSQALIGHGEVGTDAGGVMGAILLFDYATYSGRTFHSMLRTAIRNALIPTVKQQKNERGVHARTGQADDEGQENQAFIDNRERSPVAIAEDHDAVRALRDAVAHLPGSRKWVGNFIINHILEHGEKPTVEAIAQAHVPPVSKERGAQLARDTLDRLRDVIQEHFPQLAEDGVNGWEGYKEAFQPYRGKAGGGHGGRR
jgi:hypothetical protein